ncbi:MAG: hypothetical protein J6S69_01335 [Proteobacteria bacterium]|nr:hypothetical protein [Pseudomonadota bacterium]
MHQKTLNLAISTCAYWNRQPQKFKLNESIGLYKDKSIRAIGTVIACITALKTENNFECHSEFGEFTDERIATILNIINLRHQENIRHWYYFVCIIHTCVNGYHLDTANNRCVADTNDCCGSSCARCTSPHICSNGSCGAQCQAPLTKCNNECHNYANDIDHCGGCNKACAT